jgi:hypothetical protein
MNQRTLEGRKSHLKKDPGWRPYRSHNRRRVLDDREEGSLANYLRMQIRKERYIAPLMVNLLAKHLKQLLEAGAEIRPNWGDEILNSREIPVTNTGHRVIGDGDAVSEDGSEDQPDDGGEDNDADESGEENGEDEEGQRESDEDFGEEGNHWERIPCSKFKVSNEWRSSF